MAGKTVLITGASSGIGQSTAETMLAQGYRVIGTSRKAPTTGDIAPTGLTMVQLDVCDDASVKSLYKRLSAAEAMPDIWVLNAGFGLMGPIEHTSVDNTIAQFDTNFIGVHRVIRQFLPTMRAQPDSRLIVVSSLAAQVATPFQGMYSASKAAVSNYAGALRMEVAPFDIHVSIVEPGDHKSEFGAGRVKSLPADSPYEPQASRAIDIMETSEQNGPPSQNVADLIAKVAATKNPKFRYMALKADAKILLFLQAVLPHKIYEGLFMNLLKMPKG